jgi:hypothetical protein
VSAADTVAEAAQEGVLALRYRIERLRSIADLDDALVREVLDHWSQAASVLEAYAVAMRGQAQ